MRGALLAFLLALPLTLSAPGPLAEPAYAAPDPSEVMEDPVLEDRARRLYTLLRCVVCQSQSLDDSNATLAEDMRGVVRERLLAGESDDEILAFMRERYGDYVLMQPPFQASTAFLWLFPVLGLVLGGAAMFAFMRRQQPAEADVLDDDEAEALARLRDEEGQE